MTKNLLNLFLFLSLSIQVSLVVAQAPNAIPYQGVARNASGDVLSTQAISLRISLRDVTANGSVVYQETHGTTTTALGLFNVNIGEGTPSLGSLASINWGNGAKFIQVEMDSAGGSAYVDMGTSQLNSVPYSLYAATSGSISNPQWTTNSNNINNSNSGNVGIGTMTPAAKLDVAGTVKIADGSQGAGKILKSDATGLASWGSIDAIGLFGTPPALNLTCPTLAGSAVTGGGPYSLAVSGNYAYVVNYFSNKMQVINISNPAAPTVASSVVTGNNPNSVAVAGNYAYVLNINNNTMSVINISNSASPTVVGFMITEDSPYSIAVAGNYAYVVNYNSNTMQVINITNPTSPTVAGSVATGDNPTSVAVAGNYVYVLNAFSSTMQVINITNPASPTVTGSVATGSLPQSVAVAGNYAYVVNVSSGTMQVINISNPASPTVVGSVVTGVYPYSVAVAGNYAYVVNNGSNSMKVINISNPATPTMVGSVTTGIGPMSVAVAGNYVYAVNNGSNNIQSFNLACSQNFTLSYNPATGQTTAMQLQWNSSGNDIGNANSGNVGIGTGSPSNKLSVSGNADISGNMGIGTATPSNKLSVSGSADISGNMGIGTISPSNKLSVSGNADIIGAVGIGISTNDGSIVPFRVSTSSQTFWKGGAAFGSSTANVIMGELSGVATIGGHNNTLTAWSNLAINAGGGNVSIGTTVPTARLSVNGTADKPGGGSWAAFSDSRLKQNINTYNDGLSSLLKIKPITYHYNEKAGIDTKPEYVGVLAQDLKEVAPYMVSTFTKDGTEYLKVDNSAMTYMLINSIKEQQAQIETLKAENEKLKTENTLMKIDNATFKSDIQQIKAQLGMGIKAAK